jgi:hypothetical protein
MYKIWYIADPRRSLVALALFLATTSSCSAPTGSTGSKVRARRGSRPASWWFSRLRRLCRSISPEQCTTTGGRDISRLTQPPFDAHARISRETASRSRLAMAMLSFEKKYRVRGGTLLGGDLFDFWVGPFYVGFFGVTTAFFSPLGTALICMARRRARPGTLADQHRAAGHQLWPGAGAAEGRRPLADHHDLRDRRLRSWALREVEICRKLGIGYHVPFAFSVAIFAYVTLVVIRPSCWAPGDMASRMASSAISIGCRTSATSTCTSTTIPRI